MASILGILTTPLCFGWVHVSLLCHFSGTSAGTATLVLHMPASHRLGTAHFRRRSGSPWRFLRPAVAESIDANVLLTPPESAATSEQQRRPNNLFRHCNVLQDQLRQNPGIPMSSTSRHAAALPITQWCYQYGAWKTGLRTVLTCQIPSLLTLHRNLFVISGCQIPLPKPLQL